MLVRPFPIEADISDAGFATTSMVHAIVEDHQPPHSVKELWARKHRQPELELPATTGVSLPRTRATEKYCSKRDGPAKSTQPSTTLFAPTECNASDPPRRDRKAKKGPRATWAKDASLPQERSQEGKALTCQGRLRRNCGVYGAMQPGCGCSKKLL